MACPDVPLCLGRVVPPLVNAPITVHFLHRVLALVVALVVLAFAARVGRQGASESLRRWTRAAAGLVATQIALGVASVLTALAVWPVSLHTVVAASLLAVLVHIATVADASSVTEPTHVVASVT
jgi:cytochrome c oxidase assembly protein subunit 15